MSCRLYRDDDGQIAGAPSVGQLRQAIEQAPAAAPGPRDPGWLDALGRAGRGRVAPAERGLRAVHQAVLRSFVHTGAAPGISSLAKHAVPFDVSQVLAELADGDFLCLDHAGQITAAYPFSALPTRHRVRISGKATVFAMCVRAAGLARIVGAQSAPMMTVFDLMVRVPAERMAARLRPLVRRPGWRAAGRRPARW